MRHSTLNSRVGLRVLVMFVIAAGLPMLLLAALSQRTVSATLERSQAALVSGTAKAQGMQALDRLRVAEQALLIEIERPPNGSKRRAAPLLGLVHITPTGSRHLVRGDGAAAALLTSLPLSTLQPDLPDAGGKMSLRVIAGAGPGERASLVMSGNDPTHGETLAGLIDPAFLWDNADDIPAGLWLCVLGPRGQPLHCSDEARAGEAAQLASAAPQTPTSPSATHAVWPLFLRSGFDAQDWSFVVGLDARSAALSTDEQQRLLPIAAAAGLLLAVLLSLVQIRRTLGPLAQLAQGARALAARRFDTRLDVRTRDEFGELANAFNEMAQRLEGQFDEIESLAEIDREIVEQRTLTDIHRRIVRRLARVLPGRPVGIGELSDEGTGRIQTVPPAGGEPITLDVACPPDDVATLAAAPGWLRFERGADAPPFARPLLAAGWPIVAALPLRWGERCFGFLLVGQRTADDIDDEDLRQVMELRNRGAIAASAADREATLRREARFDSLTGLLNRRGLHQQLTQALHNTADTGAAVAVLFIDLDRFKAINDRLGHAAGDAALRQVADRLLRALPREGVAARLAGDEFVVVLQSADAAVQCTVIAERLCQGLQQPLVVDDNAFAVSASIGIALGQHAQPGPEELLRQADHAMYEAKRHGGNRYERFDQQLDEAMRKRLWIEQDLPLAAGRGELRLLYQPRITRATGGLESVEALIRWQHPQRGLCMPGEFIPIAESSELIESLGRWVIDTACAQVRAWRDQGIDDVRIAVNLSARQLGSDRLLSDLDSAFSRHGIAADRIELEITEGVFVEQTEATVARLLDLRRRGIVIALDDFGTGYSSMAYLRSLPIDVLKIDRAFVKDLDTDASALAVARAIVALASSLGMRTVAEGVETAGQLQLLHDLGCDEIQGYLFSRPLEAPELTRRIVEQVAWQALTPAPPARAGAARERPAARAADMAAG